MDNPFSPLGPVPKPSARQAHPSAVRTGWVPGPGRTSEVFTFEVVLARLAVGAQRVVGQAEIGAIQWACSQLGIRWDQLS